MKSPILSSGVAPNSRATAHPSAAEIEVEGGAAPIGSWGTLGPLGDTRGPASLSVRPDPVTAANHDLLGTALVAHVPNDPVLGCSEHGGQSDGQRDKTQSRGQR
ncbi:MAG: hypothetical protein AAF566_05150 [Pseudomonadota bacterium]